jgi:hypothetical protein
VGDCTILKISKEDFLESIKDVEADREMYELIKEELIYEGYSEKIDYECLICSQN